jgi:RNA polymerase primary sigma factor
MRKISSPGLSQLLMQLPYTPQKKRRKQLDAAEELFSIIDKDMEYPFEFVCFRITGFHLKSAVGDELIKGSDLLEDLRVFISKLSGQIALAVAKQSEKIYTVEELAKNMRISTKTIYRWRKRGLIAEKFVFETGEKRLGFSQSVIDKFLSDNPELTSEAGNFSRITAEQKRRIISMAAKLAKNKKLSRSQIIDQICNETHRSREAVRYTLVNHDKINPEKAIFKNFSGVIDPAQAAEIYKLYKQGCKVEELMERFNRNKSSIYRIINRRRAKVLLAKKIEFIPSEEFLDDDSKEKILSKPLAKVQPPVQRDIKPFKLADSSMSKYLQVLKDVPVLNRESEIDLFRRYNFLKFLADRQRTNLPHNRVSGIMLKRIEGYLAQAEEIKKRIIEANLRLVVSIARKHTSIRMSLFDLVSEGNISLMHAVEKFDYTRGFRFSTFASWTIAKDYARKIPGLTLRFDKSTTQSLADIHRELKTEEATDFAAIERAHQSLTRVIKDNLNEREQYIILHRFGLIGSPIRKETKTLIEIGRELNLSKERIRQIELIALQKLRHSLSAEEFELLTG